MTCDICCEDYTEKLRRPIQCKECKNEICLICFKRHLLDNRHLECMFPNCNKVFNFAEVKILTNNKNFSDEVMDKIANIALEEEKNYLPQRQDLAKRRLDEQKFALRECQRFKERSEIYKEKNLLYTKLQLEINNNSELLEIVKQIQELTRKKYQIKDNLTSLMRKRLQPFEDKIKLINKANDEDRRKLGIQEREKKNFYTFIKQCSFPNCKGFLEDKPEKKGWNCPLCENLTCRKCHETLVDTLDEDGKKIKHQCKEEVLMNIKELKKDTKPCPKCGTGIFKINGCNMMFCISCQTYFDWVSGKISTRALHNPEALDWMRRNGRSVRREVNDDGCTDPLTDNHIFYEWMYRNARSFLNNDVIFNTIMDLTNYGTHIVASVLPRFNDNYIEKTRESAIDYLINEGYDDHKWSRDIRKFKKQQMFYNELQNIVNLLVEILRTVLGNIREMIERKMENKEIEAQLELIPQIAEQCNQKFKDIKSCFNSKRKDKFHIKRDKPEKYLFQLTYK